MQRTTSGCMTLCLRPPPNSWAIALRSTLSVSSSPLHEHQARPRELQYPAREQICLLAQVLALQGFFRYDQLPCRGLETCFVSCVPPCGPVTFHVSKHSALKTWHVTKPQGGAEEIAISVPTSIALQQEFDNFLILSTMHIRC